MCAQKPIKEIIEENYETGEFKPKEDIDYEEEYKNMSKTRVHFFLMYGASGVRQPRRSDFSSLQTA